MNNINVSEELGIFKFSSGIKLAPLDSQKKERLRLKTLLQLPFPVYFSDMNHVNKQCNEACLEMCGFDSFNDCLEVEWYKPFMRKTVLNSIYNDTEVITRNEFKIIEELIVRKGGTNIHTLSVRMPWYNQDNKIIGLFGCSIVLDKNPLADSLAQINALGLLNKPRTTKINNQEFTDRERDCLRYTVRGYSAKQVASILHLSPRTVEEYLNNIKRKLNIHSKSELIDITIDDLIYTE